MEPYDLLKVTNGPKGLLIPKISRDPKFNHRPALRCSIILAIAVIGAHEEIHCSGALEAKGRVAGLESLVKGKLAIFG